MSSNGSNGGADDERRGSFIEDIIAGHRDSGRFEGRVHTRFPPEPNGYLHIGHVKAICANFGIAERWGGRCNLRFDDTNPIKEEDEYVRAITEDVRWLGFAWDGEARFASDYFERLYEWAEQLVRQGDAYVDDLSADEIRAHRGTLTEPGRPSPYRDRSVEENLDLLRRMRAGEFPDGSRTLRAKIDMTSGNINMRDPVMYRVLHAEHHRTGDAWNIYPMYDWAHGQSDSIEGITHSLCTLEFEDHRPLYDWFLEKIDTYRPQQIEFARLEMTHTVMSKRKLLRLVKDGVVEGWDDPRMPTIAGMRRRGYTPEALRTFCDRIGLAKAASRIDFGALEYAVREHLNMVAPRVMCVLRPLKLTITNWPEGKVDHLEAVNNPEDESAGTRQVPFSGNLWIERDDFLEDAPRKWFRLAPGREVRLRYGYFVTCREVVKNDAGEVVELRCTYDPETRGGNAPDGRKVRGTIHWVSAEHAVPSTVRLYEHLFAVPEPEKVGEGEDVLKHLNPSSLDILEGCMAEPMLADVEPGWRCQFERLGYFVVDTVDSREGQPVFNRTVTLRDTWAKIARQHG